MTRRTGFSLVEVMVAIVLTGTVALISYGSLRAAIDTGEKLEAFRAQSEALALMRELVRGALRHSIDGSAAGHAAFRVGHAQEPRGEADSVEFLSRGISSPLGAKGLWLVTLATSGDGVRFRAFPIDDSLAVPFTTLTPGISRLRISEMRSATDQNWVGDWDSIDRRPYAVRIDFLGEDGSAAGPSLVVTTAIGTD